MARNRPSLTAVSAGQVVHSGGHKSWPGYLGILVVRRISRSRSLAEESPTLSASLLRTLFAWGLRSLILLELRGTHHVRIGCHQVEHVCGQFAKQTCGLVGARGIVLLSEYRQRSVKLASGKIVREAASDLFDQIVAWQRFAPSWPS